MKPQTSPQLPPALRKARKPEEISNAFPPIVPRPRPEPPPPAPAPAPVVAAEPAPPAPVPAAPPIVTAPAAPKTRPKPVFTGRPAVAALEGKVVVFEGTFRFEGTETFTTETKLTGNPRDDRQSLIALARQKHPTGQMELKSTRIFTRELGGQASFPKGTSVGQLFGESGSPTENQVQVAEVFFQGEKCSVMLRNLRSRNSVTVALRAPGGNPVVFSNQIASNSPAHTLASIIREVLGQDCRELKVTVQVEK